MQGELGEVTELLSHDAFVRSDAVVSRLIGGETLVVPVRGGVGDLASIYSFNEVGSTIWEALAKPISVTDLTGVIAAEYDVDHDQARQDLEVFLTDMQAAGLVAATNSLEMRPARNAESAMRGSV